MGWQLQASTGLRHYALVQTATMAAHWLFQKHTLLRPAFTMHVTFVRMQHMSFLACHTLLSQVCPQNRRTIAACMGCSMYSKATPYT